MGILIIYLVAVNVVAFVMYGMDKRKAIQNKWRISESTLIGLSFAGGGVGAVAGMVIWHHKTRKTKFKILVPVGIIIWIVLLEQIICGKLA